MRHSAHRAAQRLLRDSGGATITEYAIILFLVAVVAATGFRFLGDKLSGGMNKAGGHLVAQNDTPTQAAPAPAGGGGAPGAKGGAAAEPAPVKTSPDQAAFGGPRVAEAPKEESHLGKFAMIALGIIGCGAVFFAIMKGKNAPQ
jgi:Flp pilus assembly pilin Flp